MKPSEAVDPSKVGLPKQWRLTKLELVTDPDRPICYGILMPKENLPNGVPYVKVKDIKAGKILVDLLHRTSPEIAAKYKRSSLRPGDLLVTIRGTYGRVAFVPDVLDGANITQDTARLAIVPEVRADFISYQLNSDEIQNFFKRVARGVAVKGVNIGDVKQTPIKLAPLAEQQRIVTELETQFTRLDVGIAGLLRVRANLKRYRASVLKAACEGRLVPTEAELARAEGRDYEPADRLLARILQDRGMQSLFDQLHETQGEQELPEGWAWTNLQQLKEYSLYGPRFSSDDYASSGRLVLRTSDISESGKVNRETPPRLPLNDEEFAKYQVRRGDLLITRTGSLGTLAVFNDTIDAIAGAYLIQYRLATPMTTAWYVYYQLKSPFGRTRLLGGGAGVGRPNLNAPTIEAIPISLPPLTEQERIVAEIERLFSLIDDLETVVSANLKRAERLRQAILKRAFEGKLVPQDPDDEPAGVLLERIRRERKAEPPLLPGL